MFDLGDGYSICDIREIQTVKKEPQVIYVEDGVDEETKETIYKPVEIIVDVTSSFGQNTALMDFNTGEVYLINDIYDGGDWLYIYPENFEYNVIATENAIYIRAEVSGYRSDYIIYRIEKNAFSSGNLVPMTNPRSVEYPGIELASDSTLIYTGNEPNSGYGVRLIRDISPDAAPIAFDTERDISVEIGEHKSTFSFNNFRMVLDDNVIHCFTIRDGYLITTDITYENDELIFGDAKTYRLNKASSDWGYPEIMDIEYLSSGIRVIAKVAYSGRSTIILQLDFINGNISIDELEIPEAYANTNEYILANNRIYWLTDPFTGREKICYTDFSSKSIHEFDIEGKSVASSTINVLDDGSVVFWQNMGGTEIATYSWNVDKDPYPTLLMTDDVDVKQIMSIDTL